MERNGLTIKYEDCSYKFRINGKLFATVDETELCHNRLKDYTDMEWACVMVGCILMSKMIDCDNPFAVETLLNFILRS